MFPKLFLLVVSLLVFGLGFELPENNCPKYLRYQRNGSLYEARIYVPNDFSGDYVYEANGSLPFSTDARMSMKIANMDQIVENPVSHIVCKITFPSSKAFPRITAFLANGVLLCTDAPYKLGPRGTTSLWAQSRLRSTMQTRNRKLTTVSVPPLGTGEDTGTDFFSAGPPATELPEYTSNPVPVYGKPPPKANEPVYGNPPPKANEPVYGKPPPKANEPVYGKPPPKANEPVYGNPPPKANEPVYGKPNRTLVYSTDEPPVYGADPPADREPPAYAQNLPPVYIYGQNRTSQSVNDTGPPPSAARPTETPPRLPEPEVTRQPEVSTEPELPYDPSQCGKVTMATPLVVLGKEVRDGECPWMVAVHFYNSHTGKYQFRCTANLISNRHVLTVGHCVQYENVVLYDKADLVLVLGLSNLENWARRGVKASVADIRVHPSYVQNEGGHDLAVLTMTAPVRLGGLVYPICLWDSDEALGPIMSGGAVAGWGQTSAGAAHSEAAYRVDVPVVTHEQCLRSHGAFSKIATAHTFCGGSRNGAGPCGGDSGSGFFCKQEEVYRLRGLVAYVTANNNSRCDLNNYVVFADIAEDTQWVRNVMNLT